MRRARWLCLCLLAVLGWGASATAAPPTDPAAPSDTTVPGDTSVPASSAGSDTTLATGELPPALGPLVVVPSGCVVPAPARAVFAGELSNTDQPPTTARFRLVRVLAGNLDGYASGGLVDVHYGGEAHFLTIGVRYIVGVVVDAVICVLYAVPAVADAVVVLPTVRADLSKQHLVDLTQNGVQHVDHEAHGGER